MNDAARPSPVMPAPSSAPALDPQELGREALRVALANAIDHARMSQRHVAVLIIELSRPDRLEALLGIPTSEIMRRALKRLPGALRPVDRFMQLSDEKLCIVLPNLKSETQAWLAAGKMQQTLEVPFSFDDVVITARPIIGIALFPDHANHAEHLIVNADIAERIARSRDIAQHVFQAENRRETDAYLGLEGALREAIRTSQLEVHYQPQVSLKTGKCVAVEGLLRWNLGDRGPIAPPAIIRIAEANGMIGSLTSWVLNTVLRHQAEWRQHGLTLATGLNFSTVTLGEADLPDVIGQALGTWGSDPARVTVEITESATIDDEDQSLAVLNRLKKMGLRLSVDDFGTGYSSLSYVKNFPLDELKIDKMFVQHMRHTKGDQQIVRSVIDLAHNFELSVVAEGVEDEATYKELKKMGCDVAQGFLMSPALPAPALLEWLGKHG
jgi:EAL domain-containing protein (putative c-di-GMP-specific phosphodiesterase class I)/GGDEF domain-containing protein